MRTCSVHKAVGDPVIAPVVSNEVEIDVKVCLAYTTLGMTHEQTRFPSSRRGLHAVAYGTHPRFLFFVSSPPPQ